MNDRKWRGYIANIFSQVTVDVRHPRPWTFASERGTGGKKAFLGAFFTMAIRIESGNENILQWLGGSLRLPLTCEDTDFRVSAQIGEVPPGTGNPPHCHQFEDEYFFIVEGRLDFKAGHQELVATSGDLVTVPGGVPHQLFNNGATAARILVLLSPGHLERAFRSGAKEPGKVKEIFPHYGIDFLEEWDPDFQPVGWQGRSKKASVRSVPESPSYWMAGDVHTVLLEGRDTEESFCLVHSLVPPGGGPVPHVHRRDLEAFFILRGELTLIADDRLAAAQQGDVVVLPPNIPHAFKNRNDSDVEMLILTAPAGFDRFIGEAAQPAGSGRPSHPGPEEMARLKAVTKDFGLELRPDLLRLFE